AYEGMERFFPKERILLTGNPVRQNLTDETITRNDAAACFNMRADIPTILLVGGSLGARTLNESVLRHLDEIAAAPIQFIWQTGGYYKDHIATELSKRQQPANLYVTDFISRMDYAYKLADLVISRAGASSISELCLLGKACILVPSPNVAEDHQTHNAMALVKKDAALYVKDADATDKLIPLALSTVTDHARLQTLGTNAGKMAFRDSARIIAQEVINLVETPTES
ncbi:MAG: UDP-N-acetylglucosamine--N-acetylmuramyl-(pentapeptide) pyrophosphoryl-undecaprenol N-acetylglucosamine transferase, partial [Bacteroidaceae bacterium]|nr:UDP-N-acetylglucosamine--N-acetylmuramyl-(pentapeptide) pyrophosphoryl-undecaprenol N-acetylglucosamine transferase [Bacteroidaceae bacterium]